jgi:NTP pyrophosphatase (non-canonical NTP hydrolase)
MERIEDVIQLVNQVRHRLGWDVIDTNETMMGYLNDEVEELKYEIAQNNAQGIQDELMDVMFVCFSILHDNHIDLATALKEKLDRVVEKYESR